MFATPLAAHISDSNPQIHSRLAFTTPDRAPTATCYFLSRLLSCDSSTDGRTVLTPQHHLPSVPTLTLTKTFWNLLPGLASTPSSYPPSCPPPLVALCLQTPPLSPSLLQRPLPPLPGPLPTSKPLLPPLPLPPSLLYGNMSLMFY